MFYGINIPSVSGAKGAYTSLGAAVSDDTYGIRIYMSDGSNSAQDNTHLVDIAMDPAGGTGYAPIINNLLCAGPSSVGGINLMHAEWFFPLFIKAGSTLAARAQIKGATIDNVKIGVRLYQKPTRPDLWRTGRVVETLGADTVNTKGTTLTIGAPSQSFGNWVSVGSPTQDAWWIQVGATQQAGGAHVGWVLETCVAAEQDATKARRAYVSSFISGSQEGRIINIGFPDALVHAPAGQAIYQRFATFANTTGTFSTVAYLMR